MSKINIVIDNLVTFAFVIHNLVAFAFAVHNLVASTSGFRMPLAIGFPFGNIVLVQLVDFVRSLLQ